MRRVIPLIGVCLLLAAAVEPAFAQQRLFLLTTQDVIEFDPRAGSLGRVLGRAPLAGDVLPAAGDTVALAGGEHLAWSNSGGVVLFNTRTGATQRLRVPGFTVRRVVGAHVGGSRLVVSAQSSDGRWTIIVGDFNTGAVRTLDLGPVIWGSSIAYASRSDALFVTRPRRTTVGFGSVIGVDFFDVDVIDAQSGARLKTLDVSPLDASGLWTSIDGLTLFVAHRPGATSAFDVQTGARVATQEGLVSIEEVDEERQRVLSMTDGIAAYSVPSLALLGRSNVLPGGPPFLNVRDLDVSGQSATVLVYGAAVENLSYAPRGCTVAQLTAMNADTGAVGQVVDLLPVVGQYGCRGKLFRLTEPGRVTGLVGRVDGRRVALEWKAAPGATRYDVHVGLQAGAINLALSVVDNRLVVDDAPPGVYFLRVQGVNAQGAGTTSQELRLVVE